MIHQPIKKAQSTKTENSLQQSIHVPLPVSKVVKLHRAHLLARLTHSIFLYRAEQAFSRVRLWGAVREGRYRRMGNAIWAVFRRGFYEGKQWAVGRIKREMIRAEQNQIYESQRVVQSMSKSSKSIICLILKSKRRQIITQCFEKLKIYAAQTNHDRKTKQRKAIRKILDILFKNKRYAFERIYCSRAVIEKRQKIRSFVYVINSRRRQSFGYAFWKLKKNLMDKRKQAVQNDIKIFQNKINNSDDPQLQAVKQKKDKLQQHLNKVQQEKNAMQQQFMVQYRQMQNRRVELETNIRNLQQKKLNLQQQIKQVQQQIKCPFSIDQIYQCLYHNFLLYLHQHKQTTQNKTQLLASLTHPLIPIDVPISTIKQQNQAMQELLNQYIVMFGPRKCEPGSETEVVLPYEYLVRENHVMYKMLLTLLEGFDGEREYLRGVRDGLYRLGVRVRGSFGG